jgi:hypothetical protein
MPQLIRLPPRSLTRLAQFRWGVSLNRGLRIGSRPTKDLKKRFKESLTFSRYLHRTSVISRWGWHMSTHRWLRRKAASKYLDETHGIQRAPSTLAKLAVLGGGPIFRRAGRVPLYSTDDLDEWVASLLSGPMRSTSDTAAPAPTGSDRRCAPTDFDRDRRSDQRSVAVRV